MVGPVVLLVTVAAVVCVVGYRVTAFLTKFISRSRNTLMVIMLWVGFGLAFYILFVDVSVGLP